MADREWILLNPGPANTSARVREALVMPDLCHREPECFEMMRRCRDGIVRLAGAGADWTAVLFTGSGTASVEAALCSAVPSDRALLVVNNGVYGDRMLRIARAHGMPTVAVSGDIFTPVRAGEVEAALVAHPEVSHVAVVHHETTTGLLNPVAEVGRLARAHEKLLLIDSVSGLAGDALDLEAVGADLVVGTGGKCIQGFPGLSFVLVRQSVVPRLLTHPRRSRPRSRACSPRPGGSSWPRTASTASASRRWPPRRGCLTA